MSMTKTELLLWWGAYWTEDSDDHEFMAREWGLYYS